MDDFRERVNRELQLTLSKCSVGLTGRECTIPLHQ